MQESRKNLFKYIQEIYKLKTKIVKDYKNYEKVIDTANLLESYSNIAQIHDFTPDLSGKNEYFSIKYIKDYYELPKIPTALMPYIVCVDNEIKYREGIDENFKIEDEIQIKINDFCKLFSSIKEKNKLIQKYNDLYEYLYELNKRINEFEEKTEIMIVKGVFFYSTTKDDGADVIRRHVFEASLDIQVDVNQNIIYLKLNREEKCKIVYNFLSIIDGYKIKSKESLFELEEKVNESYLAEEPINFLELYDEYLNDITLDYEVVKSNIAVQNNKSYIFPITNIIVRKKQPTIWLDDLNAIDEKLENNVEINNNFIDLMLETESDNIDKLLNSKDEDYSKVLFPLETNEEQYRVVNQAKNSNLVLVQGPPGTGKSHTIANLISHYVANGKKILITSEKSKALEVIREKLPEKIRKLSIAILNDSKSDNEMLDSIQTVLERYKDKDYLENYLVEINNLDIKHDEILTKKQQNEQEILKILINDTRSLQNEVREILNIDLPGCTISDIAKYLTVNKALDIINDENIQKSYFEVTFKEDLLIKIMENIEELKKYYDILKKHEVVSSKTLNSNDFSQYIEKINEYNVMLTQGALDGINKQKILEIDIEGLKSTLTNMIKIEKICNKNYILKNYDYYPLLKNIEKLIETLNTNKEFFENTETELLDKEIEYDESKIQVLKPAVEKVYEKLQNDGKITIFEKVQVSKELDLISNIKINENMLVEKNVELENVKNVLNRINYDLQVKKIEKTIETILDGNGLKDKIDEKEFSRCITEIIDILNTFINYKNYVESTETAILSIIDDQNQILSSYINEKNYDGILNYVKEMEKYIGGLKLKEEFLQKISDIKSEVKDCPAIYEPILDALANLDIEEFLKQKSELEKLIVASNMLEELKQNYSNEFNNYSQFIEEFITKFSEEEENVIVKNFHVIFSYYKLKKFFNEKERKNGNLSELLTNKVRYQQEEKEIVVKLIEVKSWYNQINNMDNAICRSLSEWLSLKTKLGKGTGKRANLIRKEMQQNMQTAKNAIPIWIMPVDKVIEQYPFSEIPQFDIAIMDESSQSSILSITALMRGKKLVIVGDDKQISPISVGIPIEDIKDLQNKYLKSTRLGVGFDMETSLYDLAQNVCGSKKVVLKEHFRCLPEIIEFSNINFYSSQINCLKVRSNKNKIKNPIKSYFIEDAVIKNAGTNLINEKEIEKIIELLKEFEANEDYSGKTVGIIVLQNSNAQIKAINNSIWKNLSSEFIKNINLKVGTTYDFQGDERDVIILSMIIACKNEEGEEARYIALTKKEFARSFNVAASRAKEQSILIYSVPLEKLSPECYRYKLISYYNSDVEINKKVENIKFSTEFERDFYTSALEDGIELKYNFKIGKYEVDFVYESKNGRKIAIECDGDKYFTQKEFADQLTMQTILERCGWNFIRIRASSYYYNKENVIKMVENYIEKINEPF